MRKQETPNEYFLRCLNEAKSVFAGTKKSSNCDLGAVVHAIFNRVCNYRPWGIAHQYSCSTVGGKINAVHRLDLPLDGGSRALAESEKVQPTPEKYPRNNGRIKAKPL